MANTVDILGLPVPDTLYRTGLALLIGLGYLAAFMLISRLLAKLGDYVSRDMRSRIKDIRIQNFRIITGGYIVFALVRLTKLIRLAAALLILYLFVLSLLGLFPATQGIAQAIIDAVVHATSGAGRAALEYLPSLAVLILIILATFYGLKLLKAVFTAVDSGLITIRNFYPDWALPTYRIVRFFVLTMAVALAYPYLPGSDSDAFKGISIFLGALFTFSSSSAAANAIAGVILLYMRPFKMNDFVKIDDSTGTVVERSLLVTRLRTPKNEEVTIPNAKILSGHVLNYSEFVGEGGGVALHTSLTIGYDAPWRKVHELLLAAATGTERIRQEPKPYVLQTALNDYSITYELSAYTDNPELMPDIYSELHARIQDRFNEAGVEILSPAYAAIRNGNPTAITPAQ